MTSFPVKHAWVMDPAAAKADDELPLPEPDVEVRCHRRRRGPYSGGSELLRQIVPELTERHSDLLARRATEIIALAPDLTPLIPRAPQTLTNLASFAERTRFYGAARTMRISHGVAELLMEWARLRRPGGVTVAFRELDDADPTDHELVSVLLRRCDPSVLTVLAEVSVTLPAGSGGIKATLHEALGRYAHRAAKLAVAGPQPSACDDLAQLYIDSDGTSKDPALLGAYADLPPDERARRHSARAVALTASDQPAARLGAIPYHLEQGTDPVGAGAEAIHEAAIKCFELGYYEATMELAMRGRKLVTPAGQPKFYQSFTHKVGACLSYLDQGEAAIGYFAELRRNSTDIVIHMNSSYQLAMLYTRHLPKYAHDEDEALGCINNAIVIADHNPDPKKRIFFGAFMRNGRALVEVHRGNLDGGLTLVNEAIDLMDTALGEHEHALHRSVLLHNRAQVFAALKDNDAALRDFDDLIALDPDYADYYFERATALRAVGKYDQALADYATAIELNVPFHEAHHNRADLLRELGDDNGALRDLDYALELEPNQLDSLVNRTDLLLERGEMERARADIEAGLREDPKNARLLAAQGSVLADAGDLEAAYHSYTAALDSAPDLVAAWANRAVLLYSADRIAEAVDDLDRALALAPDDPSLQANRAIALQDLAAANGAA
jgi:tetratricopeptide (TPR) repeat protein